MQFIDIPDLSDIPRRSYPAFASGPRQGGQKICIVALTEEELQALLEITQRDVFTRSTLKDIVRDAGLGVL